MAHLKTEKDFTSPNSSFWVLAYLTSPGLAFLCLRSARVVSRLECVLGVLAGLFAHLGMVSIAVKSEGETLQGFLILLMGISIYLVVTWQYLAGLRVRFWSEKALKQWRLAGRFFGGVIAFSFLTQLLFFHLMERA